MKSGKNLLHVLFVEDSAGEIARLTEAFRAGGFTIDAVAATTESALHTALSINTPAFDLALCGSALPDMDTLTVVRLLRRQAPDLPVIVVASATGEEMAVELMRAGASDFVLASNLSRLLPVVERELNEADQRRQKRRLELLHRNQSHVLELMALGLPLTDVLTAIAHYVEVWFPDARACLMVRVEESRLLRVASPHLPAEFAAAIDELPVGPEEIGCGAAAHYGEPVHIPDIAAVSPERWHALRDLALRSGLRACWSQPILTVEDATVGTLTVYFTEPRTPTTGEQQLLREATFLPRIAIERQQAEERLRRNEERYRRAVDQASAVLYHLDRTNGQYLYLGERIRDLTGFEVSEFSPTLFRSLLIETVLPGEAEGISADAVRERMGGQTLPSWRADYHIRARSGEERWLSDVSIDVSPPGGQRLEALGLLIDITERKSTEQAIDAARKRVQNILECMADGFILLDREGNYLYLNPLAEKMMHREPGDLIGKNVWEEFPELRGTLVEQNLRRVLASEEPLEYEEYHPGFETYMEVRTFPTPEGVSLFLHDVTERKVLQAQVLQSTKLAAMGELVTGVTHEINNPLSVIRASAQLLAMHPDLEVHGDAEAIIQMTDRINRLVKSLLTFARRSGVENCPININDSVRAALDIARFRLRQTGVTTMLDLMEPLPRVLANGNQIEQILLNLLNNAEYATRAVASDRRRITLQTGVLPATELRRPRVFVRVVDSGTGIPRDILPRIFEPFFTTKSEGEGTGLGLSICQGIAREHGGELKAENVAGGGASFTLALPIHEESDSWSGGTPTLGQAATLLLTGVA
jgi:PAS domain S-box-containing protein